MINGKVGRSVDEEEVHSSVERGPENIFVLPILEHPPGNDFRLLILADGNNRAGLEGKTYDDGGRNVVDIARGLAQQEEVSVMVACILSPDNLEKRSPEFFRKLHKAFVGLGVRMETQGLLVDDGIRLEFYGDLEKVARHSPEAAAIVQMIPWLAQKTVSVENPSLRLVLALSYDEAIAEHFGVHAIFRSGMEKKNSFRSSGICARDHMLHVGTQTLWPDVTLAEVQKVVQSAREQVLKNFARGYTTDDIREWAVGFAEKTFGRDVTLTFPCSEDMERMAASFSSDFLEFPPESLSFTFFDSDGRKISSLGKETAGKKIQLVPRTFSTFAADQDGVSNDFSSFIAPGQVDNDFFLPSSPKIGSATVFGCPATNIIWGVQRAVWFSGAYPSLRGKERSIIDLLPIADWMKAYPDIGLMTGRFLHSLERNFPREEREMRHRFPKPKTSEEAYNLSADFFVAKMMPWVEEHWLPMNHPFQYRAVINYFLTSFFMVNCPNHPQWRKIKPQWEKTARTLAKYMGLVYLGDEEIFDLEPEGEGLRNKQKRLRASSRYLQAVVQNGSTEAMKLPRVKNARVLRDIAEGWVRDFIDPYKEKSHPALFQRWRDALANLYVSSEHEWNEEDGSTFGSAGMSHFIQRKLAKSSWQEGITAAVHNAIRYEQQLYMYLYNIMNSIGAGLAFRTVALTLPPEEVDDELISLLDEICALSNFYFRIKNDVAGYLARGEDDQEAKRDSLTIACEYFSYKGALASVFAIADLHKKCEEIRADIVHNTLLLRKKSPFLAMVISRASIAEDIYDGGHYRTRTREDMKRIFSKNRTSGVD